MRIKDGKLRTKFYFQMHHADAANVYLQEMARKGWMLESINGANFCFRPIDPIELHFSVEIFADASITGNYMSSQTNAIIAYAQERGWYFVCGNNSTFIFVTENQDTKPVYDNETLKLDNIYRAFFKEKIGIYFFVNNLFFHFFYKNCF